MVRDDDQYTEGNHGPVNGFDPRDAAVMRDQFGGTTSPRIVQMLEAVRINASAR